MAVDIKTGGTFEAGVPEPLFRNPNPRQRVTCWKRCISANGQRFLVNEVLEVSGPAPLTMGPTGRRSPSVAGVKVQCRS